MDSLADTDHRLDTAVRLGQVNNVKEILNNALSDLESNRLQHLLHLAVSYGQLQVVRTLINDYSCPVNCENESKETPLHNACGSGHLGIIKMLILEFKAGMSLNARDEKDNTPLNTAALNGHTNIVKLLIIDFGCSANTRGYHGQTIFHQACAGRHMELAETLVTEYNLDPMSVDDYGNTSLHLAALNGKEVVARLLITKYNCPVDCRNKINRTPLHCACLGGHHSVVKILVIEFKADINVCDRDNNTPLNTAALGVHAGESDIVRFLIDECGCNPSTRGYQGQTILHQACAGGLVELVQILLTDYLLDPMSVDDYGSTALHLAALNGREQVVNLLITKYKCPVNCRNNTNKTPLHFACEKGHLAIVNMCMSVDKTLLLSADVDGNTPQHISSMFGMKECVHMMLNDYHAPIYIRNKFGKSVLDVAKESVTKPIIQEYLKQNNDRIHYDYKQVQTLASETYSGAQRLTRVFVLGNSASGKTTLIEALKRDGFFSMLSPVSEASILPHTCGIIPSVHYTKSIGRVIYYDFAGDPEYYSSHSAIVSNVIQSKFGTNIFLVVVNLTKSIETICDELGYWSNFISYHIKEVTIKYEVLVIGSHVDLIADAKAKIKPISQFVQEGFSSISQSTVRVITLNCCQPRSARNIHSALTRAIQDTIPYSLTMKATILFGLLEKDFKNIISCTLQTIIEHINETGIYLPNTASSLYPIVEELHSPGLLLIISKPKKLEDRMLCLNISKLTNEVHQHLFSTSKVQKFSPTAIDLNHISMGILPQKYLKSLLPEYITTDCLVQLQYCQEFTHSEVKLAMKLPENVTADSSFFYFPALCNTEKQNIVTPDRFNYSISWYGKCGKKFDYFPPRFLHVLLLRLAYIFSLPMQHDQSSEESPEILVRRYNRRCAMWKNGIQWLMLKGVDCFVEMVKNSKGIIVITKSKEEVKDTCTDMLFKIIKEIREAKKEFCLTIALQEYLMNSDDPASFRNVDKLYSISDIKETLESGKSTIVSIGGREFLPATKVEHLYHYLCNMAEEEKHIAAEDEMLAAAEEEKHIAAEDEMHSTTEEEMLAAAEEEKHIAAEDEMHSTTEEEMLAAAEEEKHIAAVQKAIEERGTLNHTVVHGVFVGPARSGKNSLMERLLGRMPSSVSPSTGVAENVVQVQVIQKSTTFAANIEELSWSEMDYDDEAIKLMLITASGSQMKVEVPNLQSDDSIDTFSLEDISQPNSDIDKSEDKLAIDSHSETDDEWFDAQPNLLEYPPVAQSSAVQVPDLYVPRVSPIEIFKAALQSKGYLELQQHFERTWSLYLTNTGGQMEFQEVLPLLVSGPSIFFFTFRLDRDLHEYYSIKYELSSGEESYPYTSTLSTIDGMLQTLASISAMETVIYSDLHRGETISLQPKVFFVGTHKDHLNSKLADDHIARIDKELQDIIRSTAYRKDLVEFASESQLIFTVDNFSQSDSDFKHIRAAVQRVIKRNKFQMTSPTHWLIFSLALRKLKDRVISYDICLEIAKQCGLADDELDEALHFIHSKMGLIRYFPYEHIKGLVFIDPQFLFDKVTELIVSTFTFEKVGLYEMEQFKHKGIFSLEKFSYSGTIMSKFQFGKLLERLRIVAPLNMVASEIKYFLPCVLAHACKSDSLLTYDTPVPNLLISFECGYIPKGVAGALIKYLMTNEMESCIPWKLSTDKIFKNEVSFCVGPYDTCMLRIFPTHFDITCIPNPKFSDERDACGCPVNEICTVILKAISNGVKQILRDLNYIRTQHYIAFPCPADVCKGCHPAPLNWYQGHPRSLHCNNINEPVKLPINMNFWEPALQAEQQNRQYPNTIKARNIRLDERDHPRLLEKLNLHSAKWREIGSNLGFLPSELDNIQARPLLLATAPKSFLHELLAEWLQWAPGDSRGSSDFATREYLREALNKAGLGKIAGSIVTVPLD